jgi:hypothetical protein
MKTAEGNVDVSATGADGFGDGHDGRDVRDVTIIRVVFVVVVAIVPATRQPCFVVHLEQAPRYPFSGQINKIRLSANFQTAMAHTARVK